MRYRISEVRMKPGDRDFERAIRKKIKKIRGGVDDIEIIRESIDARKKPDIRMVYTLDFTSEMELDLPEAGKKVYSLETMIGEEIPSFDERPVIAGFGPAGMFAGLILAEAGMRPRIIERGQSMDGRVASVQKYWDEGILDTESNVQFGEGGAGTFSDGKLTTGIKDVRIGKVMDEFIEAGADESVRYRQKPHIGTDRLRSIVKNIRKKIISLGGTVEFSSRLTDMKIEDGRLSAVEILDNLTGEKRMVDTTCLIAATGHSAADTFRMMYDRDIAMEQKPFSIGVRIEHPQKMIDRVQYADEKAAEILGAAEYKLNHRCRNGRGVYTFCMCPGGEVIDSGSEKGTAVTNGMSNSLRDGEFANSGLLVDVRTSDFGSDHPLAGIDFQRRYERLAYENGGGRLPVTTWEKFRKDKDDPVRRSLPGFASESIIEAMPFLGRKLRGFDRDDARMTGVETRSSSPVRVGRDDEGQCSVRGVFPAGEGPGYAGGITSAAVDGIKAAEKVIRAMMHNDFE